jgi:hypothetical protein
MTRDDAVSLVGDTLLQQWKTERYKMDRIDRWARWEHDDPHRPQQATAEYEELAARAQAPWGDLIVGSVAQTLYVEGYRRPDAPEDSSGWRLWQANGMDARQIAIHRAALTYGIAYGIAEPGETMLGEPIPVMRGVSPREMLAVYEDPANDEWPLYAMRVRNRGDHYKVDLYDSMLTHHLEMEGMYGGPEYVGWTEHGTQRPPVVRYVNRFDLEGRSSGEIEPFIPILGKIDQTSFDRLVVQRFASWVVRTIAGMSIDETVRVTGENPAQAKLRLKVEDILVAEDKDTKFGSLPATDLRGFIAAHESDLSILAAVSQTPAFEMLGQMSNLSADALAAAKASQTAKSDERKHSFGEAHEQFIRLALLMYGDAAGAEDFEAQVRWADTQIRSMAQAADALGKMATMLGVPVQVLWPKIPGFSQQDVSEAKQLAESSDALAWVAADIERQMGSLPGVRGDDF